MKTRKLKNSLLKKWICALLTIVPMQIIFSHGTVTYPPSRIWICYNEIVENNNTTVTPGCTAAVLNNPAGTQHFYNFSEVGRMDAGDMHRAVVPDGNLASAGRPDTYGGLDLVMDEWAATPVTPGPFTLTWTNTAPHQTLYYRVYITPEGYNPATDALTWDSLELLVETGPRNANAVDNIDFVLPARTGKHVLYSVWQRSLTPEAFYSTSDIDFGASSTPVAPVASFTSDNGDCGGPIVTFDASESYDLNGDTLTYTWDFGDGNTAEGVEVTHVFADGIDSSEITLTVSDGSFSSGATETIGNLIEDPECSEGGGTGNGGEIAESCGFDVPRESAMPIMYYRSYNNDQNGSITVLGENGPDLTTVRKMDIDFSNGNINTFFFQEWAEFGGGNITPTVEHTFNEAASTITISGTGIDNLDGTYYTTVIENETYGPNFADFIMVSTTGDFAIYYTYDESAPDCSDDGTTTPVEDEVDGGTLTGGPFVFTIGDDVADNVTGINLSGAEGDSSVWIIEDESGNILAVLDSPESFDFDTTEAGRYFIYHLSYNGVIQNLEVGSNMMALVGDYDFSNSIDVTTTTEVSTNTAPVASLIATPLTGTEPLEVSFDASGSTDADGDTLSYTIDYGDGTSGTGVTSTNTYTAGTYTATVTVTDGQGGVDSASVTITVEEDEDGGTTEGCVGIEEWDALAIYSEAGSQVVYNDNLYENKWYTRGQDPESFSVQSWDVWTLIGSCDGTTTGGGGEEANTECGIPLWSASETYSEAGTQVVYNGTIYENQWYSRNENPESYTGNEWSLWTAVGTCDTAAKAISSNFKVSSFPNPTNGEVTVAVTTFSGAITGKDIVISNLYGQVLDNVSIAEGEESTTINLDSYPSGIYLILVYEGTQIIDSHKVVRR